jgi:hypothetical protein
MYPDVSQMYLTCPVTFQENTCILTFCMYFTRIPNESKIHFGIHIRYIKIHVSWALPWCHTGYISDTSRYTEIQNHDTCILDGIHAGYNLKCIPRIYPERYVTEMQDTFGIHLGYIRDTCICRGDQDTCGIHLRFILGYMYLKCIQRSTYLI